MDIDPQSVSIERLYPAETIALRVLLIVAFGAFAMGVFSPVITLTKFMFIENTFSVFSGIWQLFTEGQIFLFILIVCFSVILPLCKLFVLSVLLGVTGKSMRKMRRYLHWMHLYGKWSMLDVFVVAILVVAVKLDAIADVQMRFGLYFFAASVVLTMLVTARVVVLSAALD